MRYKIPGRAAGDFCQLSVHLLRKILAFACYGAKISAGRRAQMRSAARSALTSDVKSVSGMRAGRARSRRSLYGAAKQHYRRRLPGKPQKIDRPKVPVPRFMAEEHHAQKAARSAAEKGEAEQRLFGYAPRAPPRAGFIHPVQYKRGERYGRQNHTENDHFISSSFGFVRRNDRGAPHTGHYRVRHSCRALPRDAAAENKICPRFLLRA